MINIETLLLFLFIFATLSCLRLMFKFAISILQTQPEKLVLGIRSLVFYGISFSYIITYLIRT